MKIWIPTISWAAVWVVIAVPFFVFVGVLVSSFHVAYLLAECSFFATVATFLFAIIVSSINIPRWPRPHNLFGALCVVGILASIGSAYLENGFAIPMAMASNALLAIPNYFVYRRQKGVAHARE
jgi:hypothetical protein